LVWSVAQRTALPVPPDTLFGREIELARVIELMRQGTTQRLVALTGERRYVTRLFQMVSGIRPLTQ